MPKPSFAEPEAKNDSLSSRYGKFECCRKPFFTLFSLRPRVSSAFLSRPEIPKHELLNIFEDIVSYCNSLEKGFRGIRYSSLEFRNTVDSISLQKLKFIFIYR